MSAARMAKEVEGFKKILWRVSSCLKGKWLSGENCARKLEGAPPFPRAAAKRTPFA
jgi:hypothetical protein